MTPVESELVQVVILERRESEKGPKDLQLKATCQVVRLAPDAHENGGVGCCRESRI